MNKYQLLFRSILLIWLFWFSFSALKEYQLSYNAQRAIEYRKIEQKEYELKLKRFEIGDMGSESLRIPYIFNKEDGSFWKFFMEENAGGFTQASFYPVGDGNKEAKKQ